MADVYSDDYWSEEFVITEADLDRLAAFIDINNQAQHLSTLAKRVVNGRLRHGPEQSAPVSQLFGADMAVKLWDPAAEWQVGDRVIVLRKPEERLVAHIGEVQAVDLDKDKVDVFIPEEDLLNPYGLMSASDRRYAKIVANVKNTIARKRERLAGQTADAAQAETVEIILLEHGERVVGLLLQALSDDNRFLMLNGRYFLRSLTRPPSESQLHKLAWSLLAEPDPLPTNDLMDRLSDADGDQALFGLYLALRQHPQWFTNTQPGKRPFWTLAGPPPGSFTPKHAAYDPQNYDILCLPEVESAPDVVARLWETDLLAVVI